MKTRLVMEMEPEVARSPLRWWLGVAVLAASWVVGLGCYQPAQGVLWVLGMLTGAVLLVGPVARSVGRWETAVAAVLLLPVLFVVPWDYKWPVLLMILGAG